MAKAAKTHGGKRPNAGRKPKPDKEKKHSYNVYLTEDAKERIVKKYGGLTDAIETEVIPKLPKQKP